MTTQAAYILDRFGGPTALARKLGLATSVVASWKDKRLGTIPTRHHQAILDAGQELSPPLQPGEFFANPAGERHAVREDEAA